MQEFCFQITEEYEGEKLFSSTILFVKTSKVVVTFKLFDYEERKTFDNGVIITKDMISLIEVKDIEGLYFDDLFTEKYENTTLTKSTTLYVNAPNYKNIYNDIIEVTDDSYITLYEKEFRPSGVPGMPIFFNHIDDVYEYHLIIDESSNFIVNGKKNNVVREQEVVYFSFFGGAGCRRRALRHSALAPFLLGSPPLTNQERLRRGSNPSRIL